MASATRKSERGASSAAPRRELPALTVIVPVYNEAATVEDHRIAQALSLRVQTVRNHLSRIQKKLGVQSRQELMKLVLMGELLK